MLRCWRCGCSIWTNWTDICPNCDESPYPPSKSDENTDYFKGKPPEEKTTSISPKVWKKMARLDRVEISKKGEKNEANRFKF